MSENDIIIQNTDIKKLLENRNMKQTNKSGFDVDHLVKHILSRRQKIRMQTEDARTMLMRHKLRDKIKARRISIDKNNDDDNNDIEQGGVIDWSVFVS